MKCPGQDTRYWTPDDVTEVKCARCGTEVEFFKSDGARPCPGCGGRVLNPRVALGCAEWCEHARECLGFDPKAIVVKKSAESSVAARFIEAVKKEFNGDSKRISHALAVLSQAQAILREEGGNPRVIIAAALLHDIGIRAAERKHGSAEAKYQELEGPPIARRILASVGFDEADTEHVLRIVASHHSGGLIDTIEFRILWDADGLVNLSEELKKANEPPPVSVEERFKTATGRTLAARLIASRLSGHRR